ncbi:MAG: tRNA (N(6)-L-threonylcarbamoyladenosine(37)-C(2))-methylthiotransferase MtaB [Candidatus Cellulosilyticum pullistercoris]|uniref:Threonylcarbamoyladenosine tRNA methylthiotransferase MtaB n=1 Tax=Candidatus Cellulosilyticum pullistercoris TaxID=2838521 RepID=A0A9E2KDA5_9FIRM|nr:tRNA (N(6)-L-threonylcarbamoyladenosine(37)-C(2))-methylthiotransferase MtaB [Candidatus Cellulosilyticum pullistercoris]
MRKVAFYTLGCKVNQYDTEAVLEKFKAANYEVVDFSDYADVYVVNTCTVTHLSDRKCRQMLRKTKKINENSILVAMGCYAQIAADKIKDQVSEIDIIIGTDKRNQIVEVVEAFEKDRAETINLVSDIMDVNEFEEMTISHLGERTRVYIKVQEGCNNYCSYCIIPYTRGKIRSRKEEQVVEEVTKLANLGFKEIILTGIHVLAYGKDLGNTNLIQLLKRVHEVEGIERIRMSSIEPVAITKEFIDALRELPKVCHHFHLSLQSGSDRVLKRMNRKYTTADYLRSVEDLRSLWPDVAITTDIIVGFPGETDEEFEETVAFVEKVKLAQIHIFPFSPREGTPAAKMKEQIAPEIKEKREKELATKEKELRLAYMKQFVGQEMEVLFEKAQDGKVSGYTSNYLRVQVAGDETIENTVQTVCIKNLIDEHTLLGKLK